MSGKWHPFCICLNVLSNKFAYWFHHGVLMDNLKMSLMWLTGFATKLSFSFEVNNKTAWNDMKCEYCEDIFKVNSLVPGGIVELGQH